MKKKKVPTIANNLYIIKLVWKCCPARIVLTFVMSILSFLSWVFYTVFFMRYLFDSIDGLKSFNNLLLFIWIVVFINLIYYLIVAWYNNIFVPKTDNRIRYYINRILFDKVQSVDITCYEKTDFYDSYTRATIEAYDRAIAVIKTCATLFSASISSIYVIYVMGTITLYSLPFIIFPLIGNLYFGKKLSALIYKFDQECVSYRRRQDYINRIFYFKKYTGEIRTTNIYNILDKLFMETIGGIYKKIDMYAKKRVSITLPMLLLQFSLAFQGIWILGAFLALQTKTVSLSEFIVLSSSIVSVTWMVRNFTDSLIQCFSNANYIENLKHFMNYTSKIDEHQKGVIPSSNIETIEFKNVSFQYEGQVDFALKGINLIITGGTKNALVGINGSGKTTFLKLLMRFYDPTEGEILLNGIDIRKYDVKKYRGLMGTAFQDFALFSSTIINNVMLKEVSEKDQLICEQALKDSGLYDKIQTLEKGMDSILTREFDKNGIELSGGEKQKLAIARAFAKKSPIVILDEPSSALDPIAEYTMYESIIKLCNQESTKTAILVSHRLSSAALCDFIYMFDNGYLIESGSHAALINQKGAYADMFHKQAHSYMQQSKELV